VGLAVTLIRDRTLDPEDLLEARPATVVTQGTASHQIAAFNAIAVNGTTGSFGDSVGYDGQLAILRRNVRAQCGLILFDNHHVIATRRHDLLG
jgi:hypothetical protein